MRIRTSLEPKRDSNMRDIMIPIFLLVLGFLFLEGGGKNGLWLYRFWLRRVIDDEQLIEQ